MDISQFVIDFIKADGVSGSVLVFMAWFLTTRFWPWYTQKYWPAVQQQKNDMIAMMGTTANAIIEVKTAITHMSGEIENLRRDMGHMRDITLSTNQDVTELREWSRDTADRLFEQVKYYTDKNGRAHGVNGRFVKHEGTTPAKTQGKRRKQSPEFAGAV